MVQGLKFLSKKSFHPQNRSNQKRVWEHEQEKHQEQTRLKEREAQLRRERQDEELAKSRGDNKLQFLYKPPPGLVEVQETNSHKKDSKVEYNEDVFERQPGDDDAVAAFRRLLAGHANATEAIEEETNHPGASTATTTAATFGTVLQGSTADRSDAPKPLLTALEKSVGRKKHQNLTFDEQIQRFPALANAPRAKGISATDVGVTFQPLGTQIRNVRCLACGIWGHSRGDRECSKTGWDPFAATSASSQLKSPESGTKYMQQHPSIEHDQEPTTKRERRKDDDSSSSNDDERRHKRHRKSRDRSPSRSSSHRKRKEKKKKSKKFRKD